MWTKSATLCSLEPPGAVTVERKFSMSVSLLRETPASSNSDLPPDGCGFSLNELTVRSSVRSGGLAGAVNLKGEASRERGGHE